MNEKRVRLTERLRQAQDLKRRESADDPTPFPGDLNRTRTDPKSDGYSPITDDPGVTDNDGSAGNGHDAIGFGIPVTEAQVAAVRVAAGKATRLAVLLLGERAPAKDIQAQALDFLKLGGKGLDAALTRYAATEALYPTQEAAEDKKCEKCGKATCECKDEDKKAAEKDEDKKAAADKQAAEAKAEADKQAALAVVGKDDEGKKDEDKEDKEDKEEEGEDKEASAQAVADELGIELTDVDDLNDEELLPDPDESVLAVALLGEKGEPAADAGESKVAGSKKSGIKTLGGQPKVAAAEPKDVDDVRGLWPDAPVLAER